MPQEIRNPWIIVHQTDDSLEYVLPLVRDYTSEGYSIVIAELIRHVALAYGESVTNIVYLVAKSLKVVEHDPISSNLERTVS